MTGQLNRLSCVLIFINLFSVMCLLSLELQYLNDFLVLLSLVLVLEIDCIGCVILDSTNLHCFDDMLLDIPSPHLILSLNVLD